MKKMRKRAKHLNQKGFSLVEVLMAVVILGLIAAPVCQMLMTSYQVNRRSKRLLVASDIAQTTMESITALCWEDTSTLGGTDIKGVKTYYTTFSGTQPLYPNKLADADIPINNYPVVYGTLTGVDDTHDNQRTFYFSNVQFMQNGVDDDGNTVMMVAPGQNGEKPFKMEIEFLMTEYSQNIMSPSKAFYSVDVQIKVLDEDGSVIHVMNSALVSKFRDDR